MNPENILDDLLTSLGFQHFALLENKIIQAAIMAVLVLVAVLFVKVVLKNILTKITNRTATSFDNKLLEIFSTPIIFILLLLGFSLVLHILGFNYASIPTRIILTIVIIVLGKLVISLSKNILEFINNNVKNQNIVRNQTLPLFKNISLVVLLSLFFYFIMLVWNVNMTALIASAGVMGIAVGFAAKDTLANLFSGVFILADQPYKIGDYVVLDNLERGEITHIGIRSTRVLTRDDVEVTVPNAIMGNTKIINETGGRHPKYRIRAQVGVAYGSDIVLVREILMKIAGVDDGVCADPEPRVRLRQFGPSSLDFELLCWIEQPELRGRVLDTLYQEIYFAFTKHNIEIPYQKHDVFIKELPKQ